MVRLTNIPVPVRIGIACLLPLSPSPVSKRGVVGRIQAALATAFKPDPDWKEF
jgi:hypothetical protein